jgi:hypothetical protein
MALSSGMSRTIDVSDLPQGLADAIEAMVRACREQAGAPQQSRPIGWAKGVLPDLPESFFDELPPDVLDLFEGEAA